MDKQTALTTRYEPSDADMRIIGNWLQTKQSEHTRRAYRRIVLGLLNHVQEPLHAITHDDVQDYLNTLTGENSTVALAYNVVKSLFTFASDLLLRSLKAIRKGIGLWSHTVLLLASLL